MSLTCDLDLRPTDLKKKCEYLLVTGNACVKYNGSRSYSLRVPTETQHLNANGEKNYMSLTCDLDL